MSFRRLRGCDAYVQPYYLRQDNIEKNNKIRDLREDIKVLRLALRVERDKVALLKQRLVVAGVGKK